MANITIPGTVALLFSNYSENCARLRRELLTDEFVPYFNLVCIDSEQVRKILTESQNIKVDFVPCILHVQPDGVVQKYESELAFKWVQEFTTFVRSQQAGSQSPPTTPPTHDQQDQQFPPGHPQAQQFPPGQAQQFPPGHPQAQQFPPGHPQAPNPSKPMTKTTDGGMTVNSIEHLIPMDDEPTPTLPPAPREQPLPGAQGRRPPPTIPTPQPNLSGQTRGPRREPFKGIIASSRDDPSGLPPKGMGHENMISSLPDVGHTKKDAYDLSYEENMPVDTPKGIRILEDIDDDHPAAHVEFGDDPSGMGIPRAEVIPIEGKNEAVKAPSGPTKQPPKSARAQKSASIKNLAAAMAAARDQSESGNSEDKQNQLKPFRQAGVN